MLHAYAHRGEYLGGYTTGCWQGVGLVIPAEGSRVETPPGSLVPGMEEKREEAQPSEAEKHEKQVLSPLRPIQLLFT